jgi:hypothetical protein
MVQNDAQLRHSAHEKARLASAQAMPSRAFVNNKKTLRQLMAQT